jgi:tetratricopeptide (TPR) repeat protein
MDGRRSCFLALCLFAGIWGCSHNNSAVPVIPAPQTVSGPVIPPPGAVVKKEADLPKRTPKATTCVAKGDWHASEAAASENASAYAEQHRNLARVSYQQAIQIDPKCLTAYQGLANLYVAMEDFGHAVETYKKALEISPKDGGLWFDLGMVHARHKDWNASLEALNKAVQLDPENRQYVNTLGYALARAGRTQDALVCFSRVQDPAKAHYNLARMLEHMGQPEPAKNELREALRVDPNLTAASEMLGRLEGPATQSAAPPPAPLPLPNTQVLVPPPPPTIRMPVLPVVFTEAQCLPENQGR